MTLPMSDTRAMRDLTRSQIELHRTQRRLEEVEEENRRLQVVVGAQLVRLTGAYPNLGPFLVHLAVLDDAAHPLTVPDRDPDRPRGRTPVGSEATPGAKVAHWSNRRRVWNWKLARLTSDLQHELDETPRLADTRTRCNRRTEKHPRGLVLPYGSTICSICHQPLNQEVPE